MSADETPALSPAEWPADLRRDAGRREDEAYWECVACGKPMRADGECRHCDARL